MRYILLLTAALLLGGCTNVAQMQRKYEAGDLSQLDKLIEIAARADYPYATRRKAAKALGEIGDPRAVPVLIAALREYDQRTTLKQEALVALGRIGDPVAVEPIGRMLDYSLSTDTADMRMAAIEVLGQLGGTKAAEILINALRYYDILILREEQRAYRGVFSGEERVHPFTPGYADSTDPGMRGPAMGMFPEGQRPPVSMFGTMMEPPAAPYNPTPEERALTHAALVRIGAAAVPVIEDYLADRETTHTLRQELLAIIREIQEPEAAPADSSRTGP